MVSADIFVNSLLMISRVFISVPPSPFCQINCCMSANEAFNCVNSSDSYLMHEVTEVMLKIVVQGCMSHIKSSFLKHGFSTLETIFANIFAF